MIINIDRNPELSLYYLGAKILNILVEKNSMEIEELLQKTKEAVDVEVHVDFFYYALDWLYLLGAVKINKGKIYYDNKKINSKEDETFRRNNKEYNF